MTRKIKTLEEITQSMRERFNVGADAALVVKSAPMEIIEKSAGDDGCTVTARITTDDLDADYEVVIPQGIQSVRFDKSGAIFWNHDYNTPVAKPIGKLSRSQKFIDATCQFAKRPDDYEGEFFPDFVRAMVQQGIVRGVSIGFIPIETRAPTNRDREVWGDSLRRVITKAELLEWSFAGIPSNASALVLSAVGKGIIAPKIARDMFGVDVPDDYPIEPKEVIHVVREADPSPAVRVHHRILDPVRIGPPRKRQSVKQMVSATIDKMRGRMYPKGGE